MTTAPDPHPVLTVERRVKSLKEYINAVEDTIIGAEGKQTLCAWLDFIGSGWDSSVLMRWYPNFSGEFGFYLSYFQERIDQQKLTRDKLSALSRRNLETQQTKVTVDQAKAAALMDPGYVAACELLHKLERLYNFLSYVKEGMDPNIIQAFGHNQRLEQRADAE